MMTPTTTTTSELLKVLPELTAALYRAAPHEPAHGAAHDGPLEGPLTAAQMKAIIHLASYGPQPMGAFAAGMGTTPAAASEMVERLVERGIVERASDPHDRRIVYVGLASEAKRLVDRVVDGLHTEVEAAFAQFPSLDKATLVAFLAALTERLKATSA
jgi:DNA-binding MarR family transcriptional regulator